jgi:transaldolase
VNQPLLRAVVKIAHDATPLLVAGAAAASSAAADLLAPVFARTRGADGFVSLEVAPELANDVDRTLDAARRLWADVSPPSAMINIPATAAGVDATRARMICLVSGEDLA